jgi:hypothetical protein
MRYTLGQVSRRKTPASRSQIAKAIRSRKPKEMRVRGDGSADDHYMSEQSISNLLSLMAKHGLLVINDDGKVSVSTDGQKAAESEKMFELVLQSSIKTKLAEANTPLEDIDEEIRTISLPLAPDAETIYDRMANRNPAPTISYGEFRRLLYLFACAKGIDRLVRVHYSTGD